MVEMFGVYALLLAAWGVYSQRRTAGADEEAETATTPDIATRAPSITVRRIERGDAARRHAGTTAGV
jgi:hypothetical protein